MTLISNRVAQTLHLPLTKANLAFSGVQGTPCKAAKHLTQCIVSPLQAGQKQVTLTAAVVETVTDNLPVQETPSVGELPHLQGLDLADPCFHKPGRIDILLGADAYPELLVPDHMITGPVKTPAAQRTIFGWAIVGPVSYKADSSVAIPTHFALGQTAEDNLDALLSQFWESEEPEQEPAALSVVEEQVQAHYSDTVTYDSSLPRRNDVPPLGDSRAQAHSRYITNEKSILRRGIWKPFQNVVQEYLDLGHAELIPSTDPTPEQVFYLPMHSVAKQTSTSTKLRVVFDGSASTTSGISLNRSLHVGPTLHPTLGQILMTFRTYNVALSADISKMYREIELAEADRDLHRFLWRSDPQDPILDYRMRRVTFGVSASPYLAIRTLQQTAADHGQEHPDASHHIYHSFYVDDFLAGADTVD